MRLNIVLDGIGLTHIEVEHKTMEDAIYDLETTGRLCGMQEGRPMIMFANHVAAMMEIADPKVVPIKPPPLIIPGVGSQH